MKIMYKEQLSHTNIMGMAEIYHRKLVKIAENVDHNIDPPFMYKYEWRWLYWLPSESTTRPHSDVISIDIQQT
jgi:hypothetical protein